MKRRFKHVFRNIVIIDACHLPFSLNFRTSETSLFKKETRNLNFGSRFQSVYLFFIHLYYFGLVLRSKKENFCHKDEIQV